MGLSERMQTVATHAIRFKGILYRSTAPKYATETDLLTGEGARRFGGRWNPIGLAAVYGSEEPSTAFEETLAHHRYYNLPVHSAMPRTFVAFQATVRRVVNLTDGEVRRSLRVSQARMLQCDWRAEVQAGNQPLTQLIGDAAAKSNLEGIRVPSSAEPGGINVILFPENFGTASKLEILSPDKL